MAAQSETRPAMNAASRHRERTWTSGGMTLRLSRGLRSIPRGRESRWMQRLKERHQCGGFRWTQVFPVSRHISPALDYLTDQLILRKRNSHAVQLRPALSSRTSESVAVVALFGLKNQRALPLQCRAPFEKLRRNRLAAPRIHDGTPWRMDGLMSESTKRHGDQQNRQHRDGPPPPTLLAFTGEKWKRQKYAQRDHRANQQCRSFHRWR